MVAAYDTTREAIRLTAPARFQATVASLPAGARLLTAIALPGAPESTPPVRFRILFASAGEETELYARTIDLADERDRRWFDVGCDLTPYAHQGGVLTFEARALRGKSAPPVLWAAPGVGACAGGPPSLLVITVAGLRADRLGNAGSARPTTPRLDAFATTATRFTRAFAGAPSDPPALAQILTGSYFPAHRPDAGLADLLGDADPEGTRAIVDDDTAAAWLRAQAPGFATVVESTPAGRATTSAALRFLTASGRCRTVLHVHYGAADPPRRWARRFVDARAHPTIGLALPAASAPTAAGDAADRQRLVDLYDGRVAWLDRELGRLLRGVIRRGRLDATTIVVMGDHGTALGERGVFFGDGTVHDESLHVPLVVRFPARGHGQTVDALVSTVDVLPTIAEAGGRPAPESDGESLLALAGDGRTASRVEMVFALAAAGAAGGGPQQMVRTPARKLIRSVADGRLALYDLANDPREEHDLGTASPEAHTLGSTLDGIRSRLAESGYQLRLRSQTERPLPYVLKIATDGAAPLTTVDRINLETGDVLAVDARAGTLTVRGTLEPRGEDQVRFDAPRADTRLAIALVLDGVPQAAGILHLGASASPAGARVDLADPRIGGEPPHAAAAGSSPAGAPEASLALWRAQPPSLGVDGLPEPADDAVRERLRQLGYVD